MWRFLSAVLGVRLRGLRAAALRSGQRSSLTRRKLSCRHGSMCAPNPRRPLSPGARAPQRPGTPILRHPQRPGPPADALAQLPPASIPKSEHEISYGQRGLTVTGLFSSLSQEVLLRVHFLRPGMPGGPDSATLGFGHLGNGCD